MFKFAERDQVSVAGTYTSVRPVVAGSKGVRLMDAGSKFLTGAVLAESRATLAESRAALAEPGACSPAAEAALVAILSEARNGLPLPKAKSASSATALPRTLG
jgi:hypothetical protein